MDLKQLQALADKMAALKTGDEDDRYDEGVDAAIKILQRAIKQVDAQEKILKLQQQIEVLQTQLTQDDDDDDPLPVVSVIKPKGRRGRPSKSDTTKSTDKPA